MFIIPESLLVIAISIAYPMLIKNGEKVEN
jgi:hypothetical protein